MADGDPWRLPRLQSSDIPESRFEVRIFTVADHAAIPPDGKLYLNGGGLISVIVQQFPGVLPPISVAGRVRVPWHLASEPHRITLRLLDADRRPLVNDPLFEFNAETGHPPGARPDDELFIQFAVGCVGLASLPQPATVFFHLQVDGTLLSVLPLKIIKAQP